VGFALAEYFEHEVMLAFRIHKEFNKKNLNWFLKHIFAVQAVSFLPRFSYYCFLFRFFFY
jgi:hypothetical protein